MPEALTLLYRDQHLVAVNKPSGLLVHKSPIDRHETRFALQEVREQIGQWVYPAHRLDKPTSGVLLFALDSQTARELAQAWPETRKSYLAIVRGWAPAALTIDHPLKVMLDKIADKDRRNSAELQSAITEVRTLATAEIPISVDRYPSTRYSLMECHIKTGRKHQIRRHLKHISHPIIGDAKYGKGVHNRFFQQHFNCSRLLLHAQSLTLQHPVTGGPLHISAAIEDSLQQVFTSLNWQAWLPKNTASDANAPG